MKIWTYPIIAMLAASGLEAAGIRAELGIGYAHVNGVRGYATPYLTKTETEGVAFPFAKVGLPVAEHWTVELGYSQVNGLKGSGVAPSSTIFTDKPEQISASVLTPFTSTETIHDLSVGIQYSFEVRERLRIGVGPTGSLLYSKAKIASRRFTETELSLGAEAELRYGFSERWEGLLGGKYFEPTQRKIIEIKLGMSYGF